MFNVWNINALRKIRRRLFPYNSFLMLVYQVISWLISITYPFMWLALAYLFFIIINHWIIFIPLVFGFMLHLREMHRRGKIAMFRRDGIDLSSERQAQAIEDYVKLIARARAHSFNEEKES